MWQRPHAIDITATEEVSTPAPWQVIVYDTSADADIVMGGGRKPRPQVSGRGMFRELIELVFVPLLLERPGTSLELLGDGEDGHHRLAVKVAGRGMDPNQVIVLHVAESGAVVALDYGPSATARANLTHVKGTAQVGPLRLPTAFVREARPAGGLGFEDVEWNPAVPEGFERAEQQVLVVR